MANIIQQGIAAVGGFFGINGGGQGGFQGASNAVKNLDVQQAFQTGSQLQQGGYTQVSQTTQGPVYTNPTTGGTATVSSPGNISYGGGGGGGYSGGATNSQGLTIQSTATNQAQVQSQLAQQSQQQAQVGLSSQQQQAVQERARQEYTTGRFSGSVQVYNQQGRPEQTQYLVNNKEVGSINYTPQGVQAQVKQPAKLTFVQGNTTETTTLSNEGISIQNQTFDLSPEGISKVIQNQSPFVNYDQTVGQEVLNYVAGPGGEPYVGVGIPGLFGFNYAYLQNQSEPLFVFGNSANNPAEATVSFREISNYVSEKGGLPGQVASYLIPTTPLDVAITVGGVGVYTRLPAILKAVVSGYIAYSQENVILNNENPLPQRIAAGLIGGLALTGFVSETYPMLKTAVSNADFSGLVEASSIKVSNIGTKFNDFFDLKSTEYGYLGPGETSRIRLAAQDLISNVGEKYDFYKTQLRQDVGAAGRLATDLGQQYVSQPLNRIKFYTDVQLSNLKVGATELFASASNYIKQSSTGNFYESVRSTDYAMRLQETQLRLNTGYSPEYGYLGPGEISRLRLGIQNLRVNVGERFDLIKTNLQQDVGAAGRLYEGLKEQYVSQPINRVKFYSEVKLYNVGVNINENIISPLSDFRTKIFSSLQQDIGAAGRLYEGLKQQYISQPLNRIKFYSSVKLYNTGIRIDENIVSPLSNLRTNFAEDIASTGRLFGGLKEQYVSQPINKFKFYSNVYLSNVKVGAYGGVQDIIASIKNSSIGSLYESIKSSNAALKLQKVQADLYFNGEPSVYSITTPRASVPVISRIEPLFTFEVTKEFKNEFPDISSVIKPNNNKQVKSPKEFSMPTPSENEFAQMQKSGQQQLLLKPEQIQIPTKKALTIVKIIPRTKLISYQQQASNGIYGNAQNILATNQFNTNAFIPSLRTNQRQGSSQPQPQKYSSGQVFKQPEILKQASALVQPQLYLQSQQFYPKYITKQTTVQDITRPNGGFGFNLKTERYAEPSNSFVKLFVKEKGVFQFKGLFKDIFTASKEGQFITGTNLSRSFRIVGEKAPLPTGYRYSRKKGQQDVFVELSKFALNTPTEIAQIQFARKMKGGYKRKRK